MANRMLSSSSEWQNKYFGLSGSLFALLHVYPAAPQEGVLVGSMHMKATNCALTLLSYVTQMQHSNLNPQLITLLVEKIQTT